MQVERFEEQTRKITFVIKGEGGVDITRVAIVLIPPVEGKVPYVLLVDVCADQAHRTGGPIKEVLREAFTTARELGFAQVKANIKDLEATGLPNEVLIRWYRQFGFNRYAEQLVLELNGK
ncbi:MAG TPA: hypothetical protein VI953_01575 [Candidatus Paceibacterota bacterium]